MNELNEKDWELINAYHDGELGDTERRALKSRLLSEPLLEEALRDVSSVSASLGALRPDTQQIPSLQPDTPANQNSRPARWLIGGAVAAAIALAVTFGPQLFAAPSAIDIHSDFAAIAFEVDFDNVQTVAIAWGPDVPDLTGANLAPVAMRQLDDGHVTHYAGRNGCRLSYFRGALDLDSSRQTGGSQIAVWATSDNLRHMIVATGMDQEKFDAIVRYLTLVTRRQASEQMLASLTEITRSAERCET